MPVLFSLRLTTYAILRRPPGLRPRTRRHQCDIHVWMLTGDKLETAISIGMSTKLINSEMNIMIVQAHDSNDVGKEMQRYIECVVLLSSL